MASFKTALVGYEEQTIPDWVYDDLAKAGIALAVQECTTTEELRALAGDADLVWLFGGSRIVTADNIDVLERCRAILRTGSGTDNVPVDAATERGIVVANTPGALAESVAEHAVSLIFAVVRKIAVKDAQVRGGTWDQWGDRPYLHVHNQTLGLVGFGTVARKLAQRMSGFEMRVLVYDPFLPAEAIESHGFEAATLDGLLSESDFVSLHCPLTDDTYQLMDEQKIGLMKPRSVLINTSRGPVVKESALLEALRSGSIAGAGIDVTDPEPPDPKNPLFELDNLVVTPHVAAFTDEYMEARWIFSVQTIIDVANGKFPRSHVNRSVEPRWPLTS